MVARSVVQDMVMEAIVQVRFHNGGREAVIAIVADGGGIRAAGARLYQDGRFAEAGACALLYRGQGELRVHGGGADNLQVLNLLAHVCWKLRLRRASIDALSELLSRRTTAAHAGGAAERKQRAQLFEDAWQLLVELGCEELLDGSGAAAATAAAARPGAEAAGAARPDKAQELEKMLDMMEETVIGIGRPGGGGGSQGESKT